MRACDTHSGELFGELSGELSGDGAGAAVDANGGSAASSSGEEVAVSSGSAVDHELAASKPSPSPSAAGNRASVQATSTFKEFESPAGTGTATFQYSSDESSDEGAYCHRVWCS